jgi:hypothetical protein
MCRPHKDPFPTNDQLAGKRRFMICSMRRSSSVISCFARFGHGESPANVVSRYVGRFAFAYHINQKVLRSRGHLHSFNPKHILNCRVYSANRWNFQFCHGWMIKSMRYRTICNDLPLGLATKIQLGRSTQHRFRHSGNEERGRPQPRIAYTTQQQQKGRKDTYSSTNPFSPFLCPKKRVTDRRLCNFRKNRLTARNVKHGQADH